MKLPPLEHRITEEMLQALFQGKKLVFDIQGYPLITLYPPRYGVFITHEKYLEMQRAAYDKAFEPLIDILHDLRNQAKAVDG
jgi:hypothetical protein